MERITEEEAKNYIPVEEDFFNTPSYYFTSIPEVGSDWDIVRYYTNRKRGLYAGKDGDEYVYVLSNKSMPEILKIGSTRLAPEQRAEQISKVTGVPENFDIEWVYKCFKAELVEREVHKFFKKERVNTKREFFKITLEQAQSVIEEIGKKYI
jgi:hypothetical protein